MTQFEPPGGMRIGTSEREEAVALLGEHLRLGRLDPAEYDQRMPRANEASTRSDVAGLFADLPEPRPAFLRAPAPSQAHAPGVPLSDKSKIIGGVLNIVLPFGIGRFYTGQVGMGLAQLLVTIFTFGIGSVWPFIDGILLLVNGGYDGEGRRLRD